MSVTDDAIEKIKDMIHAGELRAGDRLPKESELADRLGLSRSSMREAVRALSLIGVLDVRHGDGTFVSSLDPAILLDTISFVVDLHRDDSVLQFLEVRRILEPAATALAAQRMKDDDIAQLRQFINNQGADTTVERFVADDLEFHRLIAAGADNTVMCSVLEGMAGPTTRARLWRGVTQDGAIERTREQRGTILDAITARRPDIAHSRASAHIDDVEQWLTQALRTAADTREESVHQPNDPHVTCHRGVK